MAFWLLRNCFLVLCHPVFPSVAMILEVAPQFHRDSSSPSAVAGIVETRLQFQHVCASLWSAVAAAIVSGPQQFHCFLILLFSFTLIFLFANKSLAAYHSWNKNHIKRVHHFQNRSFYFSVYCMEPLTSPLFHHRRKPAILSTSNGLSFSGKYDYGDLLSGGSKKINFRRGVAVEDYGEIFGGGVAGGGCGSSIPVLDLHRANGSGQYRSSNEGQLDYSRIFGGFDGGGVDTAAGGVPPYDVI